MQQLEISRGFATLMMKAKELLNKGSPRERALVLGGAGLLLIAILTKGIQAAKETIEDQATQLQSASADLSQASILLRNYMKLEARRKEIERQYREVEFKEGVTAHLESLLSEKVQIPQKDFDISPPRVQPFGTSYEQSTFTIKLKTANLAKLVDFLKAIIQGAHPMLLTRLDLSKSYSGDRLDVEVDVSSIHKSADKER